MQGVLEYGTQSFLVRFVVVSREVAGEPHRVPAQVEHLNSGRSRGVKTGGELIAFIDECLDAAGLPPREGWEAR